MPFAVLQTGDDVVTAEQLVAAFESIERLTRADAVMLARRAFGFIASELEQAEAQTLQAALRRQGVGAAVVDQSELFSLPGPKKTKRIDCLDEHLLVADSLGRQQSVEWDAVLVVAAGLVQYSEFQRDERSVWGNPSDQNSDVTIESHAREVERHRLALELIVNGDPCRYQADGDNLLYNYLEGRRGGNMKENFMFVVEDLLRHSPVAMTNQGAVSLAMSDRPLVYPSRQIFERELLWLIWRGQQI